MEYAKPQPGNVVTTWRANSFCRWFVPPVQHLSNQAWI
jgi:hypothetical protein